MDSEGKKSQDDMKKFEEFLKATKLLKSTDLNDRFIELILSLENDRLFYELQDENIKPETVKDYLYMHENKIKEAYERKSSFENFKKHVANVVFSFKEANDVKVFSEKLCEEEKTKFFSIFPMENASLKEVKILGIVDEQNSTLKKGFDDFIELSREIVSGPRVDLRQIGVQQAMSRVFADTRRFVVRFQDIMTTQLNLTEQANKRADDANERADRLQSEKDKVIEQLSEAQTNAAVAKANINSLNKQLEDEKERADKLQEENRKLLEDKTNAAVATAKVGELKETIKAKDETVETQKQSIEMQKQSIAEQKAEIERQKQQTEEQQKEVLEANQSIEFMVKEVKAHVILMQKIYKKCGAYKDSVLAKSIQSLIEEFEDKNNPKNLDKSSK